MRREPKGMRRVNAYDLSYTEDPTDEAQKPHRPHGQEIQPTTEIARQALDQEPHDQGNGNTDQTDAQPPPKKTPLSKKKTR